MTRLVIITKMNNETKLWARSILFIISKGEQRTIEPSAATINVKVVTEYGVYFFSAMVPRIL